MSQLNTRNDRKQVKNSAKVGVSNVKISSASGGFAPLTRGFAPGPHLDASDASPAIFGHPGTKYFYPPQLDKVAGYGGLRLTVSITRR